ncbi:MAG: DinB family protein [Candidatus Heimdallarchaeota archaeon]|nr:DinB family protein [Candidatus Heimdallarchaeota archaeon]
MIRLGQLYKILEFEREGIIKSFEEADPSHFTYHEENSWSPEMLFRHILMGMRWISGLLPGNPISIPAYAVLPDRSDHVNVTTSVSRDKIFQDIREISAAVAKRLDELTDEQADERVMTENFEVVRKITLFRLITHEYKHLGQLLWLLKRSTGWNDDQFYKITFSERTWDVCAT